MQEIKITEAKESALALTANRALFTLERLHQMNTPQLRTLNRQFYRQPQASPLLLQLKEAVACCGQPDAMRAAKVWRLQTSTAQIEAALDTFAGLTVTVDGVAVCDDRRSILPSVVFLPDAGWILPMLEAYEDALFIKQQESKLNDDAERLALIGVLSK